MENQIENEMDSGVIYGLYRGLHIDPNNAGLTLNLGPPATIGGPEKQKVDVLNKAPAVLRAPGGPGD